MPLTTGTLVDGLVSNVGDSGKDFQVVQIIVDQWKAGLRQFTKDLKDFLLKAMSVEKTTEGRKTYVNDAFDFAKNQKQANIIEAFLAFDGGDRTQLCEEIWNVASPKVNYFWRDGTFDALEELRTRELNHRTYGNGRGL